VTQLYVEHVNLDAAVEELRRIAGTPAVGVIEMSSSGVHNAAIVGVRRIDRPAPIQPDDRFHIGSNTKALTALLASLTVEAGGLNWDTAAGDVLGVGDQTLRQLLAHSSGLDPYTDDLELERLGIPDAPPAEQRAAFASLVLQQPPRFEPATRHQYSNAGYIVAAAMMEAATGQPWESAVPAKIFKPLGMHAVIGWPASHSAMAPLGHWERAGHYCAHDPAADPYEVPPLLAPAGGVSLSVGDYGRFLADQLAGLSGQGRLGPDRIYRQLHTPDPPDKEEDPAYGLGWGITQGASGPVSQHAGSGGTFYAVCVLQAHLDKGLAVLANSARSADISSINSLARSFLSQA
jgi:CubicO group peptidase (beta-lactamase class C family)